jgi:Mrp family chromosome partitioning ATPase
MRIEDPPPELQEYLGILWRRRWSIAIIVAMAVIAAFLYSSRQDPVYQSSTEVLVQSVPTASGSQSPAGGIVVMEDERRVATSAEVTRMAAAALRRDAITMGAISVEGTETSHTLIFTAVSGNPISAQETAEAFAESYLTFRRRKAQEDLAAAREPIERRLREINQQLVAVQAEISAAQSEARRTAAVTKYTNLLGQQSSLQQSLNQLVPPVELRVGQVLQPALPGTPAGQSRSRTIALALFMGLSLGVGVAFLRDRLDQRVRNRHDLEWLTGAPVLAVIPRHSWRSLVRAGQEDAEVVDAYRTLCRRILGATAQRELRTLMVTSPDEDEEEAKSITTANLAFALAKTGKDVILLAAELEKRQLERYISARFGLSDTELRGGNGQGSSPDLAEIHNPWPHLWVVETGVFMVPLPDSPAVLGTAVMKDLIGELKTAADFVLVDASPILEMSDAWALAPAVDAVLCVTDARRNTRGAIAAGIRELNRVGAWLVGVVLTNSSHHVPTAGPFQNGNSGGQRRLGARPTSHHPRQRP